MDRSEMNVLIDRHMAAVSAGDADAAVSVYSEDVEHRTIGPNRVAGGVTLTDPLLPRGKDAVRAYLASRFEQSETETLVAVNSYYGEDFCVIEHEWTGRVHGHFLCVPDGHGRRVSAPRLHVWEFRDGLITRQDEWPDCVGMLAQLHAREPAEISAQQPSPSVRIAERANRSEIDPLIDAQLAAFADNDAYGVTSMCTDDLELETIGFHRVGHLRGQDAARLFYECLFSQIETESMTPVHSYYGDDFSIVEHEWTGIIKGHFLCVPFGERVRVTAPWIRISEFRDGLISRQRAWLDCIGIIYELNDRLNPQEQPELTARQLQDWSNSQWIAKRVALLSAQRAARSAKRSTSNVPAATVSV